MELENIIDDGTKRFLDEIEKLESVFGRELLNEVRKLDTKGGKIANNAANKKTVAALRKKIADILSKIGYNKAVNALIANFDKLDAANQKEHGKRKLKVDKSLLNPVQQIAVQNTVNSLLGAGLDQNLMQPVIEQLNKNVVLGSDLQQVIGELEQTILTNPQRKGIFVSYATQIGRDTLGQYQGLVNQKISNEYGLNALEYVGSLVKDSRKQCERWVEKGTILLSDLQDEINWAYNNGSGMIPGTTPDNFMQNRGGYNCRHVAIPVRIDETNQNSD